MMSTEPELYDVAGRFMAQEDKGNILSPPPALDSNVPGWTSLEFFLRGRLGIDHDRSLEMFRKFYNHYLKRFPVHYFTQNTFPDIDFILFFPVQATVNGRPKSHYLVAMSDNDRRLVLFHQNLWTNVKTRQNFHRLTKRWLENGFSNSKVEGYDIREIIDICERPEELLGLRQARFNGFFDMMQRRLRKVRLDKYFQGKWGDIRQFLEERDRHYIQLIVDRIKNTHISFDAARRAAEASRNNLDLYNWMMAGADKDVVEKRMQLTQAIPWLAKALAQPEINSLYARVEEAIDSGDRLIPVLQEFLSQDQQDPISQATVRKLLGLTINQDLLNPDTLRPLIKDVNQHWPYMNVEGGFLEKLHYANNYGGRIARYLNTSFAEIIGSAPPDLRDEILTEGAIRLNVKDYNDTVDYMRQVYTRLVLPYFARRAHDAGHDGLPESVLQYIQGSLWTDSYVSRAKQQTKQPPFLRPFGHMHIHNIVKLSIAWHHELKRFSGYMAGINIDRELRWPSILPGVVMAPNGVQITNLTSKSALYREHQEMGHCINDYSAQCLGLVEGPIRERTYSHVFSLKDSEGKKRATFEALEPYYSPSPGRRLTFNEIDGRRDKRDVRNPPDQDSALHKAALWLVKEFNNGRWNVNWDAIDEVRRNARRGPGLGQLEIEIGFDFRDAEKCAEAFRILQPYLPERYRYYDYQGWIAKMGFAKEADDLFKPGTPQPTLQDLARLDFRMM